MQVAVQDGRPTSPGLKRKPIPEAVREGIKQLAGLYPWWGYQRIAVIARREGLRVGNKRVYQIFQEEDLLQRPRVRAAEVYQTARLAKPPGTQHREGAGLSVATSSSPLVVM